MSRRDLARTLLLALALAGCAETLTKKYQPAPVAAGEPIEVAIPKLPGAPTSEPKSLPGVALTGMSVAEQKLWWRIVSELYAPCPEEAVSLVQCVEDKRACAACQPAASFIAGRVKAGEAGNAVEAAYTLRFAPPKPIDLRDSPARGPAGAPVTIVEWFDFQCPACRMAGPILDEAIAKNEGKVRLVHKFYPLKAHPRSEVAARAAFAAMQQGKYWEMEKVLFANQQDLEPASLERYAKDLHLDLARFRADAASERATLWLARDRADAEALNLDATPFIWIDGRSFNLDRFRLDQDLDAWIKLDAELASFARSAAPPAP